MMFLVGLISIDATVMLAVHRSVLQSTIRLGLSMTMADPWRTVDAPCLVVGLLSR